MFDLVGDLMETCFKTHMCRGWLALSSSSGKHAQSTLPSLPCSERGHETEFWPVEHGRKCYVPLSALTRETTLSSYISAWVLISKVTLEAWWWRWWRCNHSGSLSHTLEQRASHTLSLFRITRFDFTTKESSFEWSHWKFFWVKSLKR